MMYVVDVVLGFLGAGISESSEPGMVGSFTAAAPIAGIAALFTSGTLAIAVKG